MVDLQISPNHLKLHTKRRSRTRLERPLKTRPMPKKHSYILGINTYDHDVSACLLRDGEIAFAIGKERITREKHASGFYKEVVDYCLDAEGISLDDVELVVRNCYVLPVEEIEMRLLHQDSPKFLTHRGAETSRKRSAVSFKVRTKLVTISHHLAHAYSAFAVCPFDEGVVMVVDGVGSYRSDVTEEFPLANNVAPLARESESYYRIRRSQIETLKKVWLEPSRGFLSDEFYNMPGLGALYSRASTYIFGDWNKCGELMGLAPYGRPERIKPLLEIKGGKLDVPDWSEEFKQPWLPEGSRTGKKARPCSIGRTWPGGFKMTRRRCCSTGQYGCARLPAQRICALRAALP